MITQDLQKATQDLQKANILFAKIEAKKEEIALYEGCKIVSLTFRKFDEKKTEYADIIKYDEIPRGIIKNACIQHLRADLDNLEMQFTNLLLSKNERELVKDEKNNLKVA
jgi:hypothetical protein